FEVPIKPTPFIELAVGTLAWGSRAPISAHANRSDAIGGNDRGQRQLAAPRFRRAQIPVCRCPVSAYTVDTHNGAPCQRWSRAAVASHRVPKLAILSPHRRGRVAPAIW